MDRAKVTAEDDSYYFQFPGTKKVQVSNLNPHLKLFIYETKHFGLIYINIQNETMKVD